MKKIIFITDKVYPYFVGGQEKRIYTYIKILSKIEDVKISVISMKWWKGKDLFEKDGVKYISVCRKHSLYKKNGKRKIFSNIWFSFNIFKFLLKTKKSEVDLLDIEIFPYFPVIFSRLAFIFRKDKPKIVGHWCECQGEIGWKKYSNLFWFLGFWLEKIAKRSCDYFISISGFTKKRMVNFLGIKKEEITVIPPSFIDFEKIKKVEERKKEYDFIYFGRLIWHKHVEVIIDLSVRLKKKGIKTATLIIGEGPEKSKLEEKVKEFGLSEEFVFLDFFDNYNELISKIKSAKIMIFPSEREGFGIAPIEANACGLPVLVLDFPENATKTLIENGKNGFVCRNFDDLVRKTIFCLESKILKKLEPVCKKRSRKYSKKSIRKNLFNYYLVK